MLNYLLLLITYSNLGIENVEAMGTGMLGDVYYKPTSLN